jgi:hypothetical protein
MLDDDRGPDVPETVPELERSNLWTTDLLPRSASPARTSSFGENRRPPLFSSIFMVYPLFLAFFDDTLS